MSENNAAPPEAPQAPAPEAVSAVSDQTQAPSGSAASEGADGAVPSSPDGADQAQAKPEGPRTLAEARRAIMQERTGRIEPGQPRDEQGRFAPVEGEEAATDPEPPAEEAAAPEASGEPAGEPGDATPPAAEGPPEGMVRIELPEGHDWRRGERTHFDVPAEAEQMVRTAINNPVRRAEVESARREAQAAEIRLAEMQARMEATQGFLQQALSDPALAQQLAEIRDAFGEDAAQRHLNGLMQEFNGTADEQARTATTQVQEALQQRAAETLVQTVWNVAPTRYEGFSESDISQLITAYGEAAEMAAARGLQVDTSPDLFFQFADSIYEERMGQKKQTEAERQAELERVREEARREAAEAERQRLAELAEKRKANPLAGVAPSLQTGRTIPTEPSGPTNVHEARRALFRRAR